MAGGGWWGGGWGGGVWGGGAWGGGGGGHGGGGGGGGWFGGGGGGGGWFGGWDAWGDSSWGGQKGGGGGGGGDGGQRWDDAGGQWGRSAGGSGGGPPADDRGEASNGDALGAMDPWGQAAFGGGGGGGGGGGDGGGGQGGWWQQQWGGKVWDWDQLGANLRTIDWQGVQLKPITKNFYQEHPVVSSRSREEVDEIRRVRDIEVLNGMDTIPNPITTFEEAALPDWATRVFHDKNFREPTPIQVQVWPAALQGRDLIGIAETGSGKTLAYVMPMLVHIMAQEELQAGDGPVGVVLCPTRELAMQIDSVVQEFIRPTGMTSCCVYGGVKVRGQGEQLSTEKNDIVVATPGRFIQLLNEGWTNLNRVTYVVLDEADEMLSMGFEKQVRLVLGQVRPDRQMLMFSATWPMDVQRLAVEFCTASEGLAPVFIRVGGDRLAACKAISQTVLYIQPMADKFIKVREAIVRAGCAQRGNPDKCLIFCRSKAGVDDLVHRLKLEQIDALGLHSAKTQDERNEAMKEFRDGQVSVLVATNCLGRGHDIPRVRYVINYDAPDSIENYIHRVGRTGRAGETGYAMTFFADMDFRLAPELVQVLRRTGQKVPQQLMDLATGPMTAGEAYDAGYGPPTGDGAVAPQTAAYNMYAPSQNIIA